MVKMIGFVVLLCFWLGTIIGVTSAEELADRVSHFVMENGLRVIMVQQEYAPVIHFNLMFDVGGVDEPDGLGGIAHMVEHMAFKGTESIGSVDIQQELDVLYKLEKAADAFFAARQEGGDPQEIDQLEQDVWALRQQAQELAIPDVLFQLFDVNGAVGFNATTGYDRTSYVVSLPRNRLELWARVYGDVLSHAVFRYFYEEVDVVKEERRQRNEDDPTGFLVERFLSTAYQVHPYGRSLIGTMEEIGQYRTAVAREFWDANYFPNRAVLVLVGDVDPDADFEVIRRYFAHLPAGPEAESVLATEPTQEESRRIQVTYNAEPEMLVGFHKPTYPDRDAYVMDLVAAILGRGRTSRLFCSMVTDKRIALSVSAFTNFPGRRYPNLLVVWGKPRHPYTNADLETALEQEIASLHQDLVSDEELRKVKNQIQADFVRNLASDSGLASQLAFYELFLGGWENLLAYPDVIETVTAEEIRSAAVRYLHESNQTTGVLVPADKEEMSR